MELPARELAALGAVAPFEPFGLIGAEDGDILEMECSAVLADGRGVHDNAPILALLAQPQAGFADIEARGVLAQQTLVHTLVAFVHIRRQRVDRGKVYNTQQTRKNQRGRKELPDRHAGRAHDHKFVAAREAEQGEHHADHHGEGQHCL